MQEKIDLADIKQKIFTMFEKKGWGKVFKPFIFSYDFDNIIYKLVNESNKNKRFTPPLKNVFKAFEECAYDELQIIIVNNHVYPYFGAADGLAFSCSQTQKISPDLQHILNEINRTVYKGHPGSLDVNLKRWANQGILLLNTSLTTTVDKYGQHEDIWYLFIDYLFEYLNKHETGLIYIYMNEDSKWIEMIDENKNYKFTVKHPGIFKSIKKGRWDSDNLFNKVSDLVLKLRNYKINW